MIYITFSNIKKNKELNKINKKLFDYIDEIVSVYNKFDPAHQLDHCNIVVDRGLQYAKEWNKLNPDKKVDLNIVFVVCALHDIGLQFDRETHNIHSAKLIRKDKTLRKWFNEDEIEIIANAVEDHRASLKSPIRNIYGQIVSEADRNHPASIRELIQRSVKYNIHNNPDLPYRELVNNVIKNTYSGKHAKIFFDIPMVRKKKDELAILMKNKRNVRKEALRMFKEFKQK